MASWRGYVLLLAGIAITAWAQAVKNSVRGSLKVFGLRLGKVKVTKRSFETRALELVKAHPKLAAISSPLLRVRRVLLEEFCRLDRMALKIARSDAICYRLMTVPSVGVIVALTYRTGVDVP